MNARHWTALLALTALIGSVPNLARATTILTVPIGNPNNLADSGYGAVGYAFEMGKNEITNAQYVDFLNAVADTDTYGLFNSGLTGGELNVQGITRGGTSGSYTYAVKSPGNSGAYNYTNKPVTYVSVGDAMRFANWMHNGQPTGAQGNGTTETGAYTLSGATSAAALAGVTRNSGATWWLPNENEWYKAAYYDPNASTYFAYPTSSNTQPTKIAPPGTNSANTSGNTVNSPATGTNSYPHTDVGAYTSADSPYGTFDQGGNVWEVLETIYSGNDRVFRGGSWYHQASYMASSSRNQFTGSSAPDYEYSSIGFRLATVAVPEPSSLAMLLFGAMTMWLFRGPSRRGR